MLNTFAPSVARTHVQPPGAAAEHTAGRLGRVGGNLEAGGKIVGAALGQIAQQRRMLQLHQAAGHLVEGAVPAHRHHHVIVAAVFGGVDHGVPGRGRLVQGEQIPALGENGRRIQQRPRGLAAPGPGIDDHQKCFPIHET